MTHPHPDTTSARNPRAPAHDLRQHSHMTFELPRRRALDHLIRPTRAEVSASALRHNLALLKKYNDQAGILAVVKANAYGHGAVQVARVLEAEGVSFLGVALVEEGLELRNAGITLPILVMGGSYENAWPLLVSHRLTPTLFRHEHIEGLAKAALAQGTQATAHLKVDTGMSRLGIQLTELTEFLAALNGVRSLIELDGFMTHFADADVEGDQRTTRQLSLFESAFAQVRAAGFNPRYRHVSNTAGVVTRASSLSPLGINLVRPGIALYGMMPDQWLEGRLDVRPVLTWKTGITHLKTVSAGTPVSYGGTWVAARESRIATLPVGYADGYGRIFSNRAQVLIRGRRVPVVGRITMDMAMVDVTDLPEVQLGDAVVLLGAQAHESISAAELAQLSDTIPYEVVCSVGARVPRVLVE